MKLEVLDERGRSGDLVHFETGVPVTFEYLHNTERAPYLGSRYQQDVEPRGRYMLHATPPGGTPLPGWVEGRVTFEDPLVIAFNENPRAQSLYDETSWKGRLADHYDAVGEDLSRALVEDGHDGIVTVWLDDDGQPLHTQEIVDLTSFHGDAHPEQLKRRLMPPS